MTEPPTGAGEPGLVAYVEAVASGAPIPGGGSVGAVVAALAAALGEMVVNLTVGRPAQAAADDELRALQDRLREARRRFLALAVEDEHAYGSYRAAAALPKAAAEEQAARADAMQAALIRSADVPARVAVGCVDLFPVLVRVVRTGNKHVLSDAHIAAILAEAAVRAAAVNVRVNAALIRDASRADALRWEVDQAEAAGAAGLANVAAAVEL
jgi:formiminotetrahydrofolate cyclodeaminase